MKVVAVLNHKGGVGKTTFTGSIAQALALTEFRVLVIDNDSQHNLSAMFGLGVQNPTIRDVYRSADSESASLFLRAIRHSEIENLHIITSSNQLCESDIKNVRLLRNIFSTCNLDRFYDYVLIDNAPGMDNLQGVTIHAADYIFVPTELRQFAIDGIVEMETILRQRFPDSVGISRIIPNFYKDIKRHNTFIMALNRLFPGRLTKTAIPFDPVFDELITEEKILFLHRLYSKGAAYYLKIMHELFNLDEDEVWERMLDKRKQRISQEARQRFQNRLERPADE